MIRTTARKAMLLAAVTLFAGMSVAACSSRDKGASSDNVGSVGLALKLANGSNLNSVHWEIKGSGGAVVKSGDIDVSADNATASVLVSGLAAGTYTATMVGQSADGATSCEGVSAPFTVQAKIITTVPILLQCRTLVTTGSARLNGTFNQCPAVTAYEALPLSTKVGQSVQLAATASDADAADTVTYLWTGPGLNATTANATFTCSPAGKHVLTVKVSDGKCEELSVIEVECKAESCGNGVLDAGEACDPTVTPVTPNCTSACTIAPICGDGLTQGSEQCDDGNVTNFDGCSATCQTQLAVCGNGQKEAAEVCDDGNQVNTDQCMNDCSGPFVATVVCGDGVIGGTEQCDDGNTVSGDGCSSTCQTQATACQTCEANNCDPTYQGCAHYASAADRELCQAALACIRANPVCVNGADLQACYCGTASDAACLGTGANGVCKAQFEAAAKANGADGTSVGEDVATNFYLPEFPVGGATNLILCDVDKCSAQCGVD